jgi:hypothetical protein
MADCGKRRALAIFIIPTPPIGLAIEEILRTRLGHLFNPGIAIAQLTPSPLSYIWSSRCTSPSASSWLVCIGYALVSAMDATRGRCGAYEVIYLLIKRLPVRGDDCFDGVFKILWRDSTVSIGST